MRRPWPRAALSLSAVGGIAAPGNNRPCSEDVPFNSCSSKKKKKGKKSCDEEVRLQLTLFFRLKFTSDFSLKGHKIPFAALAAEGGPVLFGEGRGVPVTAFC